MRIFICCALFFICLAAIPSVNSDRNYKKLSEYNERDRRETRERYTKKDNNNDYKYKRRYRESNSDDDDTDEDFSVSRSDRLRRERGDNPPPRARTYKEKVVRRKYEDTDEDYSDESHEVCVDKRGRHCDSDDVTDETNEDYTDEDSDDRQTKKRVIYVKKFPHEKRKQKKDKESGTILKMHKRAGRYARNDDDDTTSEEIGIPKRRRFILEDEEE